MGDVFLVIAGPGDIGFTCGKGRADGVEAFDVLAMPVAFLRNRSGDFILDSLQNFRAHVRHDAHVHHHIGAVGDFHADLR